MISDGTSPIYKATQEDASDCVRYLVTMPGVYLVDEEFGIKLNDQPVILQPESVGDESRQAKPLVVYSTKLKNPDVFILNPFHESNIATIDRIWLYTTQSMVASGWLAKIIRAIISQALDAKKSKRAEVDISDTQSGIISLIAPYIDEVNDKLLAEFNTLSEKTNDFFSIAYGRNTKMSYARCSLFEADTQTTYRNIRRASWTVLKRMVLDVLDTKVVEGDRGIPRLEGYTYTADGIQFSSDCSNLEGVMRILKKFYTSIGRYENLVGYHFDTTRFDFHINNLTAYKELSTWCAQANIAKTTMDGKPSPITITNAVNNAGSDSWKAAYGIGIGMNNMGGFPNMGNTPPPWMQPAPFAAVAQNPFGYNHGGMPATIPAFNSGEHLNVAKRPWEK